MKIIFYKSNYGNWKHKLISWWTHGIYSHCELFFDDIDICFSADPSINKCRFKIINTNNPCWDVVDINVDQNIIFDFCKSIDNSEYDWKGIFFNFLIHSSKHSRNKFFCSEICTLALQKCGYFNSEIIACKISPNKLYSNLIRMEGKT